MMTLIVHSTPVNRVPLRRSLSQIEVVFDLVYNDDQLVSSKKNARKLKGMWLVEVT
jgi:hypothetical protein